MPLQSKTNDLQKFLIEVRMRIAQEFCVKLVQAINLVGATI